MSVSSVSSNFSLAQTDWRSAMNQWKQEFKQLASSLQSGDLAGAQKAFLALQQLQQSNPSGGQSNNGPPASSGNNQIESDFAALGKALSSGDLSAAQSAFSQLRSDMQAGASGSVQSAHHGHHHHRHVSSAPDSGSSAGSQSGSTGDTVSIYG